MYDRLLNDIHTNNSTGVRIAEGDGNRDVLIGHWYWEGMSDHWLHGTDREGGSW